MNLIIMGLLTFMFGYTLIESIVTYIMASTDTWPHPLVLIILSSVQIFLSGLLIRFRKNPNHFSIGTQIMIVFEAMILAHVFFCEGLSTWIEDQSNDVKWQKFLIVCIAFIVFELFAIISVDYFLIRLFLILHGVIVSAWYLGDYHRYLSVTIGISIIAFLLSFHWQKLILYKSLHKVLKLLHQKNENESLLNNLQEGILVVEPGRSILFTNNQFCNMFEFDSSEQPKDLHDVCRVLIPKIKTLTPIKSVSSRGVTKSSKRFRSKTKVGVVLEMNAPSHRELSVNLLEVIEKALGNLNFETEPLKDPSEVLTPNSKGRNTTTQPFTSTAGIALTMNTENQEETHDLYELKYEMSDYSQGIIDPLLLQSQENVMSDPAITRKTVSTLEMKVKPLTYSGKKALVIVFYDVTKSQEVYELKANNEFKTNLLSSVSHEMKTPLNCSIGLLEEVLEEKSVTAFVRDEYILPALCSAKLMYFLIQDVMDFTSYKIDGISLFFIDFNIRDALAEVFTLFQHTSQQKKISLVLEIAQDVPPFIFSERRRFMQILVNLLNNAFKFTHHGAIRVKISLESGPLEKQTDTQRTHLSVLGTLREHMKYFRFCVEDTGIGLSFDERRKLETVLENPTQMYNVSMIRESKGACLGLSITQVLTLLIKSPLGLKIESQKGIGSSFSFLLPVQENEGLALIKSGENPFYAETMQRGLTPVDNENTFGENKNSSKYPHATHDVFLENLDGEGGHTRFRSGSFCDEDIGNLSMPDGDKPYHQEALTRHFQPKFNHDKNFESGKRGQGHSVNKQSFDDNNSSWSKSLTVPKVFGKTNEPPKPVNKTLSNSNISRYLLRKQSSPGMNCKCLRALIVDDVEMNIHTLKVKLVRKGFQVFQAYDGKAAVETIMKIFRIGGEPKEEGFNVARCSSKNCRLISLIFMDVDMPIMNGLACTRELRKMMRGKEIPDIPIIGCSAFDSDKDIAEGLAAGMSDYLPKPVFLDALEEMLKKYTD